MEVMLAAEAFPEWLPGCKKVDHMKTYGGDRFKGHYLLHIIWNSPWPLPDYDFVVESIANYYWDNDYITVELISKDDTDIESPKGTKRLKKFYSYYKLTIIDKETTHVSYMTLSDPDASRLTPRWLIEAGTKTIPYKTLKALEKRAQNPIFMERAARELM